MEDSIQDIAVFDLKSFSSMDGAAHGCFRSAKASTSIQDFDYLSARDEIDSISRELNDLHEKLLKMNVRAHMLEVDLATQFNPDTVLDIRQVEMKCQDCTQVAEKMVAQVNGGERSLVNDGGDGMIHQDDGNLQVENVTEDVLSTQ